MGDAFIRHIELLGYEKRFFPSQHYVSTRQPSAKLAARAGGGKKPDQLISVDKCDRGPERPFFRGRLWWVA